MIDLEQALNSTETTSERATVRLGFIPLIDCAPFIIAFEKGFYKSEGVDVVLSKEASWASLRDKVAFNMLDGAHMLASLPIAATLGIGTIKTPMETSFTVSHNGNAITVSNQLHKQLKAHSNASEDIKSGAALRRVIDSQDAENTILRFAIVYPYSSHNYQLRTWLNNAGIDPDKDVQLTVISPTQMIDYLEQGEIDGYCVGEPWNSLALEKGVGQPILTGYEIWGSTPEKVFGVNSGWAQANPKTYLAMIRALNEACTWVDAIENQTELLRILSSPEYLNCSVEQLFYGFSKTKPPGQLTWPDDASHRFSGPNINKPLPNYALWVMAQMFRWQQLAKVPSLNHVVEQVYRQDIYHQALGITEPIDETWRLSPEQEKTWLRSVSKGEITLAKGGILNGFSSQGLI